MQLGRRDQRIGNTDPVFVLKGGNLKFYDTPVLACAVFEIFRWRIRNAYFVAHISLLDVPPSQFSNHQ